MSDVNPHAETATPGPVPRNVRDGAIAAAIGVTLELALRAEGSRKIEPVKTAESIWVHGTRTSTVGHSSTLHFQERWGVNPGWKPVPGRWSVRK